MNNAASHYPAQLPFGQVEEEELRKFVRLLDAESDKDNRQSAFDQLLRMTTLTLEQAALLARSRAVAGSVGLQLSLKRYVRSQEYESARQATKEVPGWQILLTLLGSMFP